VTCKIFALQKIIRPIVISPNFSGSASSTPP